MRARRDLAQPLQGGRVGSSNAVLEKSFAKRDTRNSHQLFAAMEKQRSEPPYRKNSVRRRSETLDLQLWKSIGSVSKPPGKEALETRGQPVTRQGRPGAGPPPCTHSAEGAVTFWGSLWGRWQRAPKTANGFAPISSEIPFSSLMKAAGP